MPNSEIPLGGFDMLVRPLIGLPVSLPWKGCGSTIFLELGALAPRRSGRQFHQNGEACISIDWDWRVEDGAKVLFGSSSGGPKIDQGLRSLEGCKVEDITVSGKVQELVVSFAQGRSLKSMVMHSDEPQWSIRLREATWIFSSEGKIFAGDSGASEITTEETAAFDFAESTTSRWGMPGQEPKLGNCKDCCSYVPLDGCGHFLDFGACAGESSPFDGRIVNARSGCPAFRRRRGTAESRDGMTVPRPLR